MPPREIGVPFLESMPKSTFYVGQTNECSESSNWKSIQTCSLVWPYRYDQIVGSASIGLRQHLMRPAKDVCRTLSNQQCDFSGGQNDDMLN